MYWPEPDDMASEVGHKKPMILILPGFGGLRVSWRIDDVSNSMNGNIFFANL